MDEIVDIEVATVVEGYRDARTGVGEAAINQRINDIVQGRHAYAPLRQLREI
jgi:hypothetical protein